MRTFVISVVELAGAASVSAGAFLTSTALGCVTAGLFLLVGARQASR